MNTALVAITVLKMGVATEYTMDSLNMEYCTSNRDYIVSQINQEVRQENAFVIKYECKPKGT